MARLINKSRVLLVVSCLFLSGCAGVAGAILAGFIGGVGGGVISAFICGPRYKEGDKRRLFENAGIPVDSQKAATVLYRPYPERCGFLSNSKVVIFMNGEEVIPDLKMGYFSVLLIASQKTRFSAKIAGRGKGALEMTPKAGERYFIRWSDLYKHTRPRVWGTPSLEELQILDKKNVFKELEGALYSAPLKYKAPVFDKKTGRAL